MFLNIMKKIPAALRSLFFFSCLDGICKGLEEQVICMLIRKVTLILEELAYFKQTLKFSSHGLRVKTVIILRYADQHLSCIALFVSIHSTGFSVVHGVLTAHLKDYDLHISAHFFYRLQNDSLPGDYMGMSVLTLLGLETLYKRTKGVIVTQPACYL